jgi:hypothetical protein
MESNFPNYLIIPQTCVKLPLYGLGEKRLSSIATLSDARCKI